jgi:hypothetical protein
MKTTIDVLFSKSVQLEEDNSYTEEQRKLKWIGNPPATEQDINAAELRLKVKLPEDYKDFLKIANGYSSCAGSVEPGFTEVQQIDYLNKLDPDTVNAWSMYEDELSIKLKRSILIGGKGEEQFFLLIPPVKNEKWEYWMFANWLPGKREHPSLKEYFLDVIEFIDSVKQ